MEKIVLLKIGSDIEWSLVDKNTKEYISAEGLIKGTKENPYQFDPKNKYFATSLDNVLYEGNIPPARTPFEFYKNVKKLMNWMQQSLPEHLELTSVASARYDEKYLQTEQARVYGCSVSYNCWSEEAVHPKPDGSNNRALGLHLHYSYVNPSYEDNRNICKAMDLFLGVPSILIEPYNERRKTGYGQAGNMRDTTWGVEYRSLSSHFASSQELIEWCFKNSREAIKFLNKGGLELIKHRGAEIQNTINFEDSAYAEKLIKEFKIKLPLCQEV